MYAVCIKKLVNLYFKGKYIPSVPKHNWLANCCLFVDIQNKLNSGFALTELSPETCTSNSQNYDVCVTKHGQALVRILGATDEVKQFDKARKRVKDFPGHHFYRQQYSYLSAVMETRISRAEREVRHQLKSWEQQQLAKTGEVSTTKDMLADPSAKLLLDRLKYCKTLAKEWRKEN